MTRRSQISAAASALGRRSYEVRVKRLGIERLQEIARENGKMGGRPKSGTKKTGAKGKE
ncbi:MAG: hypothetical protein JO033_10400 [Acidobacteriaceae bacterium]|nr:hypothetical protein [Acidobacteriaceae bacterium]MBV9501890.1 hypothetical protein [Acidobacteriaceae bacterium]